METQTGTETETAAAGRGSRSQIPCPDREGVASGGGPNPQPLLPRPYRTGTQTRVISWAAGVVAGSLTYCSQRGPAASRAWTAM